jgi:hypothetical protein
MAQGPILIFDKATLQALNPDQAHWRKVLYPLSVEGPKSPILEAA